MEPMDGRPCVKSEMARAAMASLRATASAPAARLGYIENARECEIALGEGAVGRAGDVHLFTNAVPAAETTPRSDATLPRGGFVHLFIHA